MSNVKQQSPFVGRSLCFGIILGSLLLLPLPARAAIQNIDEEFQFASGLIELGFPDFATRVVDEIVKQHPNQAERANIVRAEIFVARREFDKAREMVAKLQPGDPKAQAINLAIARGYFAIGDQDTAKTMYDAFFNQYKDRVPTDADLLKFYQNAAFQYGQILERLGDGEGAAASYKRVLATPMDDAQARRRLMNDLSELYLRLGRAAQGAKREEFLKQARELADQLVWGSYDLWWGNAIGTMAHVELARNNESAARELLTTYMKDLTQIDKLLRDQGFPSSISPLASARFLLGELYEKQARALIAQNKPQSETVPILGRALTEYYNVFAQYGDSEWGPEAGNKGRELIALLESMGRKVNIEFGKPEQLEKAIGAQFRLAEDAFRQKDWKKAVEEYLRILNIYPEAEESKRGLANVLVAYVQLDDPLYVKTLAHYFGERFGNNEFLGNAVLIAGNTYRQREKPDLSRELYDIFLDHFPKHPRAPAVLYDIGRMRERAGDRIGANSYYRRLVDNHPKDRFALHALFQIAWGEYQVENYEEAIKTFQEYVKLAPAGHEKVRAQYLMADAYQRMENYLEAIKAYTQIIAWLEPSNSPFNTRPDDVPKNRELLENARFFLAYCYGRITEPAGAVAEAQNRAVQNYDRFLEQHKSSALAPKAMRDKGRILLAQGKSTEAARTFEELARDYPESEEGRSALFALVSSAVEIGQLDIARDAFQRMMAQPDAYGPDEFARIGRLMLDAGLYAEVIPAYQKVVASSQDRNMLQLALFGLGQAHHQQKNYDEAIKVLEDLLQRFPQTAFMFDTRFILNDAYRQKQRYDDAVTSLNEILRLEQRDNVRIQTAQFELGITQKAMGDQQRALATFQRIALLQDPSNPKLRPIIERSILESLQLSMDLGLYGDIDEIADQYLNAFPQGAQVEDVRRVRAEARVKAVQTAPPAPAAAGTAP